MHEVVVYFTAQEQFLHVMCITLQPLFRTLLDDLWYGAPERVIAPAQVPESYL
jgi:hypothetical protein